MSYLDEALSELSMRYPGETEFYNEAKTFLESVKPVIDKNEKVYREWAVLERLLEPERTIKFRVPWYDDNGRLRVNMGYRVQYSSAIGPYKGGFRFETIITENMLKKLGFQMTMKNALSGFPFGGAKGGSDFTRDGKSDHEVWNFCSSYMTEMYRHINPHTDIPTSDVGVGKREIGYLFGQYKKITGSFNESITGKRVSFGGSTIKDEATGYGLTYILKAMVERNCRSLKGSRVVISGAGEVAIMAAEKASALGAVVVAMSDRNGYIYNKEGLNIEIISDIKAKEGKLERYADLVPGTESVPGKGIWKIPCDIALPCAYSGELGIKEVKQLHRNGCFAFAEGAVSPCSKEAEEYLINSDILYMPNLPASAGGIVVSSLEVIQNTTYDSWNREEMEKNLARFMDGIYTRVEAAANEYHVPGNYFVGSNIVAFEKVAEAMVSQGAI